MINFKAELNEPQLKAVTTIDGPVLIIAGAGSGKTRVITYRIAYMLERGIPQHAILALTFTNKAAKEMETRVRELTGKKLQSLTVGTFHAFGLSIIRDEAELLGFRKNFSIYDETDRITLIKESLKECRLASKKFDLYALSQLFSNIKTGLISWNISAAAGGRTASSLAASKDLKPVYEEYQNGLKVYNAVDFDDLLILPLELFENNPDILAKYRKRYRYIMVDEFQDTSLIQYRLMRLLAAGGTDEKDSSPNVCVVGDDDQSIYSWRGADYRNIRQFEKDFPGVKEIKLEQNYRSTSTILNAANGVISHNTNRKEKNLWSPVSGGKPVELVYPENESGEADFIAAKIRELQFTETRRYHDFGVLTRTNSLSGNIEEAFLANNIPYKVSGGTSFFQRKEIKDIISYLRVIANPQDDISLLRIINTPPRGIGRTTVAALNDIAKKNRSNIWDAVSRLNHTRQGGQQNLFQDKKTGTALEEFMELIETQRAGILERKNEEGQSWLLSQKTRGLIDAVDYYSYLVLEHSSDEKKAKWKFANIEYFIRMIENWERNPDTPDRGLYPWLNRISLITKDDGETDTLGKVSLMTIHSAKGLEFPVVFIAGAEEGLIPHEKSVGGADGGGESGNENESAGSIEEERRLFYVAITRAREKLYISSCKKRRRLQSAEECKPSPFLQEIPGHLIQASQPVSQAVEEEMTSDILKDIRARLQKS
ncbi:MAG: UvrD-helicase domain-containing protein [Treponema sp.]|jgi:DNA helicase-2/ATP-dependent DNA helicase PcrA|nr:UvrD-helicase domain-containing protein [Treponema sp.]